MTKATGRAAAFDLSISINAHPTSRPRANDLVVPAVGEPDAAVRRLCNEGDLIRVIREYSSIRSLVFVLEGSEGQIAVNHSFRALSVHAAGFESQGPRVQEIVFDNCNVVKGASEVVLLMTSLRARRATGYASFHSWGPIKIITKKNDNADGVESELKKKLPGRDLLRDYVIQGQPSFSEMAARPGQRSPTGRRGMGRGVRRRELPGVSDVTDACAVGLA